MKVILKRVKSIIFLVCIALTTTLPIMSSNKETFTRKAKRVAIEAVQMAIGIAVINSFFFLGGRETSDLFKNGHPIIGSLFLGLNATVLIGLPFACMDYAALVTKRPIKISAAEIFILASLPVSFVAGLLSN